MAHSLADLPGTALISRRTLFGLALAAGVIAPLVVGANVGAAHADSDTGGYDEEEEYEIPDDIGSAPWW